MNTKIRAPLAVIALLGAAPSAPKVHREASSTAETWKEKDGRRITRTVNRRFTFATTYSERFRKVDLLLAETFDRTLDSGAEGEKSKVFVEASRAEDAPGKTLWKIAAEGSSGEPTEENVYRVTRPGCCGAQDLSIYFSLINGKELFASDALIVKLEAPNTSFRRFVAYHDLMAASAIPDPVKREGVVGLLEYGSDREPASRLYVLADKPEPPENFAAKKLAIVANGKEAEGDRFDVWAADKNPDPAKIGGFSIRVRAYSDPEILFEIPVEGDRLVPEKAKLAKGVRLEK